MQDIHTHLYWKSYDVDRDDVILRAREVGVKEMFVIGCTVEESRQSLSLAEKYSDMYASIGIHPQEFFDASGISSLELWIEELGVLAKNKKVIAVGECGLEYYKHPVSDIAPLTEERKQWQKKALLAQIALAQEAGLPLILHCRPSVGTQDAYEDMFDIFSDSKLKTQNSKSVLHCYMGDTEVTRKFLTLPNIYFSFTGNITYPVKKAVIGTKDDLTETVKIIPLNRIFTETDCPFLAPQSKRGERNEPGYVREVLECIAKLHHQEISVVERAIEENVKKVFPTILS